MKTDIQIARECQLKPIGNIASQLGIAPEEIEPYGRYMARYPVCIAKTQFSFSADSSCYGSPEGLS